MPLLKILGSLTFAICLIAALAILLVTSTLYESAYGTPMAQAVFYRAGWFDVFLSLLWLNIFCSAALRFPFKRRHTGFVITHIGILTLLFGALLTRHFGAEGQMALAEGERLSKITREGKRIVVMFPGHKAVSFPLEKSKKPYERRTQSGKFAVEVHRGMDRAVKRIELAEGTADTAANRAIRVKLESTRAGVDDVFTLIEKDPENPHANMLPLGPAMLQLTTPAAENAPKIPVLRIRSGEKSFELPLNANLPNEIPMPELGLALRNLKYFTHAKVDEHSVIDSPEGAPFNPAVQFEVVSPDGSSEEHTKFSIFPDFASLHGGAEGDRFKLNVKLDVPFDLFYGEGARLKFIRAPGGWKYESTSAAGKKVEGPIETGRSYSTGWMDMQFTPLELYDRAVVSRTIAEASQKETSSRAAELSLKINDKKTPTQWVLESEPVVFETSDGDFEVGIAPNEDTLPFVLELKDFRKTDYPGTQKPASFESDVSLFDPKRRTRIEKTISMNEPLDYAGWRIFQSSYFDAGQYGEGSVFTIAKNPGIWFIYPGAVILFLGVFLLFYVPPLSSFTPERKESVENPA